MKYTYTFGCPLCHKIFRMDEPGEPCCTGPSETRDDHDLTVMYLLKVQEVEVHPDLAEKRAVGRLIMPSDVDAIEREARLILR